MTIDFRNIVPHLGSKDKSFEELCCQLYSLEKPDRDAEFIRKKGDGGDAGVEGYWILPDGQEHALQVKYIFSIKPTQWKQVDDSVEQALKKHPKLVKYTVCIPEDRTDRKIKGKKSGCDYWDEHVKKWGQLAKSYGMEVQFHFKGAHELGKLLAEEKNSGLVLYWFNGCIFTREWLRNHLDRARADLHNRYTPEFHVDLPISGVFDSLGWTGVCRKEWGDRKNKIQEKVDSVNEKLKQRGFENSLLCFYDRCQPQFNKLYDFIECLTKCRPILEDVCEQYRCLKLLVEYLYDVSHQLKTDGKKGNSSTENSSKIINDIRELIRLISECESSLRSNSSIKVSCERAVLITGDAGIGKSHCLYSEADRLFNLGAPVILLLVGFPK